MPARVTPMVAPPSIHLPARKRASIQRAIAELGAIPTRGDPRLVFGALGRCMPVVGGLIGVLGQRMGGATISHVVELPSQVLEGWTSTPLPLLQRMMAPLVPAAPGELISDRSAITGRLREEVSLIRVIRGVGLGESAGYKIAQRVTASGEPEHPFLTIALDGGAVFREQERALFRLMRKEIAAALSRIEVPLIASEPILAQIVAEGQIGYVCVSRAGSIVELNARAQELASLYAPVARIPAGRGWLARFIARIVADASGGRVVRLSRPDGRAAVEIRKHQLAAGVHAIAEPLALLLFRETDVAAPPQRRDGSDLSERQREAARRLAATGQSYKQIADDMGISIGTLRKHVEQIYQVYGVHSRAELAARFR